MHTKEISQWKFVKRKKLIFKKSKLLQVPWIRQTLGSHEEEEAEHQLERSEMINDPW